MPEVQHVAQVQRPVAEVWDFVRDMNHWAPFLTGYMSHTQESETDSEWTLRGDLGMLSREVQFAVHIDEWLDEERVRFTLNGLNEPVTGTGRFTLLADGGEPPPPPPPKPWWRRAIDAVLALFGRQPAPAIEAIEPGESVLTFEVALEVGGPMGPMVNALLGPWLQTFATDLSDRIVAHLHNETAAA